MIWPECNRFSVIVEKSATISNRKALICYVRVVIHEEVQNVFWKLGKLDGTRASDLAKSPRFVCSISLGANCEKDISSRM